MAKINYFVPGKRKEAEGPLARYLQPMPVGVASAYIEAWTEPGQIVLDPFCQDETILREAIQSGRKVIAVSFNPLTVLAVRGRLTLRAEPFDYAQGRPQGEAWPDSRQLDTGFTRLSESLKAGIRLREHLEALYSTTCPGCQHPTVADYFVWDKEQQVPVEKGYRCEHCGSEGLARVDPADLETLSRIETRSFHYWYIVDRVAPRGGDSREHAQKLLELYTPRNLYALASLLIKIESLFPELPLQDAFKLLLLACLDSCSNLYSIEDRARPQRLHPPARFIEPNVWRAFQTAYQEARQWSPPPQVHLATHLGEVVAPAPSASLRTSLLAWAEGGPPNAFLDVRTVRSLSRQLPEESVVLVVATPPHLDPTFWSLSYLWSGWLLGPKAAAYLKPLLGRRRTDWAWYHRAMTAVFRALYGLLRPQGRLVLVLATEASALVEALLFAASGAGFELENLLYQPNDGDQYRLSFVKMLEPVAKLPTPDPSASLRTSLEALAGEIRHQAVAAAEEVLRERGEPLAFPWLRNTIYERLSHAGYLSRVLAVEEEGFSALDFVAEQVEVAVQEAGLVRLDVTAEEGARLSLWWLREPEKAARPLGDRVEEAIYQTLRDSLILNRQGLEEAIYPHFPGFLTPEKGLIEACLESYAKEITPGHWHLREEDQEAHREEQCLRGVAQLIRLGQRLGYGVWVNPAWREPASAMGKDPPAMGKDPPAMGEGLPTMGEGLPTMGKGLPTEPPPRSGDLRRSKMERAGFDPGRLACFDVLWYEEGTIHAFALTVRAFLGRILQREGGAGEIYRYLVIPAERTSLVDFKLRRNPLLREALAVGNWQFVKYGHLAWLVEAKEIDRHDLKKIVGLKPIIEQAEAQIPLF
jgi:hypothetical protein